MAAKRMNTYIVNVYFTLPDKSKLLRKISENALTAESAKKKVMAYYNKKSMVKRLGKAQFSSVVRK